MGGMKIYLLLILNIIINKPTPALSSVEFVNGSATVPQAVAVGTTSLQFKSTNSVPNITRVFDWSLTIRDTPVIIHFGKYNQSSGTCENLLTNKTLVISASCHQYNDTHFTSMINLGPIPEDVTFIAFNLPGVIVRRSRPLTSKYCPVVNRTRYMAVAGDIKAVYNQQARFNCSKGELYDGSSINPLYYRTCQFDATWSGEIPECIFVGPTAHSKVMFETVEYDKPFMVYLNFTASPAINKNTTLLTKLTSVSNITPLNSTRYKIVNWSSSHQAMEWNIDNFTNEYEGQYIFTAWSTVAPQVMVKSFELKVASLSTIPVTITTSSFHCECKTDNGSFIGLTVGIIVAVVLVIVVVGVTIFVVKRRLHNQSDSNKPNYIETSIYENQLASCTDIESKYQKKIPLSGQKELHEDPIPTYANTQHTYQNIKPNN